MTDIEREPCPRCAEPAALAALVCPHCRSSLAVDVRLAAAVRDGRVRYRAARLVAGLGPPVPGLVELQPALASPRPVVARRVTREVAARIQDALWACGLDASTVFSELSAGDALASAGRIVAGGILGRARRRPLWMAAAVAGALAALALPLVQWGRSRPLSTPDIAARVRPATVSVKCRQSVGSGFFVAPDLVITNAHVLCEDGKPPSVTGADGEARVAETVKADEGLDLALLRLSGAKARPLALGDATALVPGERVVLAGSPLGLTDSVIEGKVSHVGQPLMGVSYVQVDANVNPGNSGGPMVDGRGRVVGVVTMMRVDQKAKGIGLALPINYLYYREAFVAGPAEKDWRGLDTAGATRWQTLVSQAEAQESHDRDEVSAAFYRPGLVAVTRHPNAIMAIVVLRAGLRPDAQMGTFSVQSRGTVLCRASFPISEWKNLDRESPLDSPYLRWLRRNHLADNLYAGVAYLRGAGCSSYDSMIGGEVVLEDGDPTVQRVRIEPAEG